MFDFNASLFWYKIIFVTELMLAEGFATYTLKKRSKFALRVTLSVLGVYVIAFLFPVFFSTPAVNTLTSSVMFLALFAVTVAALKICYCEKLLTLFFCGIVAYTTQHISYTTYSYIIQNTGLGEYYVYGNTPMKVDNPLTYIIYFGVYGIIYWFVWAFVEHKMREQEKLSIEPLLLFSFTAILFINVVLSFSVTYYMEEMLDIVGSTVLYLYRLTSSLFVYVVLYSMLGKRLSEHELETVERLWQQDRRAFELKKENIDLINIKVHDLKHQIHHMQEGGSVVDSAYLAELEKSVSIYDYSIKTGNEVLDLIFAENSIFAAKHKIKLSVIADGANLAFMSNADGYSLFGNALHNAMEAVCKHADEEKRIVRFRIGTKGRKVIIHVENYCENVIFGADGLPKTDKQERGHGYGMRSMRMIAEKYGGFPGFMAGGRVNGMSSVTSGGCVWADEQTMREIYLKPFELTVKNAYTTIKYISDENGTTSEKVIRANLGIMSSFNRVGTTWADAHKGLLVDVTRNEWGFNGEILTDMNLYTHMRPLDALMNGGDVMLGMWNEMINPYGPIEWDLQNATLLNALVNASHNILYSTVNSNAVQGMTPGTIVYYDMSPWQIWLIVADVIVGVLIAAGAVWCVVRTIDSKKHPEKYKSKEKI